MSRYAYQPLAEGEIRLLRLQPRALSGPDDLLVSIHHALLDSVKDGYEALSYTWGDASTLHDLRCSDGSVLRITSNLRDALADLQPDDARQPVRALWADAVCIDQDNAAERSAQVGVMRRIYERASKTIVHLGRETEDAALAARYLAALELRVRRRMADAMNLVSAEPWRAAELDPATASQDLAVECLQSLGRDGDDPFGDGFEPVATQRALVNLLSRPWFRRAWVIQEFVVSRKVEMRCGKLVCKYGAFLAAFGYAFEQARVAWSAAVPAEQRSDFYNGLSQMLMAFEKKNDEVNGRPRRKLIMLLREFRAALATVPQDKIYSLLGLSEDYTDLKPDYEHTSKEDIYLRIAKDCLDQGHGEYVIAAAARSDRTTSPGMPSWVPDWSEAPVRTDFSDLISASGWFFEAGGPKSYTGPEPSFTYDGTALQVKGVTLLTVGMLGNANTERVKGRPNLSSLMAVMNDVTVLQEDLEEKFYQPPKHYPTGEDVGTALAAVLAAGQSSEPTDFARAHKDYAWDIIIEAEVDQPTVAGELDADVIDMIRELRRDQPFAVRNMSRAVYGRKFALAVSEDTPYCGLVPVDTRHGDKICILQTCAVPYVMRPVDGGRYVLVGDCYFHGIMQGEAVKDRKVEWQVLEVL